jgi:hypothetical protein
MRARLILTGVAALALAACSSGAGSTVAPSPSAAAPTPTPVVTPTPAPSPLSSAAATAVAVKVHFDGTTCAYLGPEAFPAGTLVEFEFTATPETADDVALILIGATSEIPADVLDHSLPATPDPAWVVATHEAILIGPGNTYFTMAYRDPAEIAVFVGCAANPETDNTMYPAALLWAIDQ